MTSSQYSYLQKVFYIVVNLIIGRNHRFFSSRVGLFPTEVLVKFGHRVNVGQNGTQLALFTTFLSIF